MIDHPDKDSDGKVVKGSVKKLLWLNSHILDSNLYSSFWLEVGVGDVYCYMHRFVIFQTFITNRIVKNWTNINKK